VESAWGRVAGGSRADRAAAAGTLLTMEAPQGQVSVRAAVHALDAALAEHRRGLALAASRRERERMAGGREVKAAAAASEEALEQPVDRPMRSVRLAETWIEVDRARHRLRAGVRAGVEEGELRVTGGGWSARVALAPGDAPVAAAREAAARIERAASASGPRARDRLERAIVAGTHHAAACHAAAAALAAADRELAERHADHARVAACEVELAARLGPRRVGEDPEVAAARDRLEHARAHLATAPEQPYAWIGAFSPPLAGAMLRDLPRERLPGVQAAAARLATAVRTGAPLVALAAGTEVVTQTAPAADAVIAVTAEQVLLATGTVAAHAADEVEIEGDRLLASGREVATGLVENRRGRLAAALELVRAAGPAPRPPAPSREPEAGDPVELLRRLGELRDRGVLEPAEFEAKKAELLRRI
jgi:Short C-terminal domain